MDKIFQNLNEEQQKAVKHIDGPMLILAGAGSGKTKTITSRLAYLISVVGIAPSNTLTLTFTNKAANEMKNRALDMLEKSTISSPPLLCTFHKFGLLFLKFHISRLDRKNNFVIIDTNDKKRILKSFESDIPTAILGSEISKYKNTLLSVNDVKKNTSTLLNGKENDFYAKVASIYERYENYLKDNNLVDFDDLLMLTYKILDSDDKLANEISQRYQYIMVDEYQDTNDLQLKLLQKLCKTHNNICVVGDDDQSIYGWRGTKIENILNFKDQFDNVKIVKLEQNYRSTASILKAANELIEHNRNRLGKKLISTKQEGNDITIFNCDDESVESSKITTKIKELLNSGVEAKDIAILYRINALSRSLEEGLNRENIHYKMVGGVKFYERTEIKDIISYLRLAINQNDDFSLERIINRPKRGLGKVTIGKIQKVAFDNKTSIYQAINNIKSDDVGKKNLNTLLELSSNLEELSHFDGIYDLINMLETKFGIKKFYEDMPDGAERVANIDEFYALLRDQAMNDDEFELEEFLNEISLQSDQDSINEESISIMSIHASKGLEFKYLFVIGLEEGFFPLIGDGSDIEEERRLAYVAITRAKEHLTLSHAESRFYKGKRERLKKSRFLSEAGLCEGSLQIEQQKEFKKGDLIKHKIFGIGRIVEITKVNQDFKLKINFGGITREIMSNFVEKAV
ncbi:MAG: UvrD-helicase domain-containing protein [Campylobacter sputorum]|uniref:ATP-dependent helicase n=1 Tax=Campylobacter sputorum TaxID=206 RepID=UPI000B77FF77|nr:UvrD-helicase domain-containing protein [Campylobacter sputorum]ASM38404.1 UvrD/REP family helicase [Campylobacter sputorum bv. paraureolyticus LMG 11764]MDY6120788.1 UvrD-helicase domain-containing protein [Campylobacter sputorum]